MKKIIGLLIVLTVLISLCPAVGAQESKYYLTGMCFVCKSFTDVKLFTNMIQSSDLDAANEMLMAKRCVALDIGPGKVGVYPINRIDMSVEIRVQGSVETVWTNRAFIKER